MEKSTDASADILNKRQTFFRKIDWSAFWVGTVSAFLVYFFTAAPSVTLEDAGELAVAGDYLGVPHPPGYPLWTICAYIFARMLEFVTFRGQPNPAWAIAILSAFFGALAAGITAMLITRTGSDALKALNQENSLDAKEGQKSFLSKYDVQDIICWVSGVGASLVFAFSPVMWSQSTIVEVYSLNAFFLMLIFLLTYRWMKRPNDKFLWITAFVFGLGLTNYQVLLLAIIPLVIVIFLQDIDLFRDFVLVAIPFGLTTLIMKIGAQVHTIFCNPTNYMPSEAVELMKNYSMPSSLVGSIESPPPIGSAVYIEALIGVIIFVVISAILGWLKVKGKSQNTQPNNMKLYLYGILAASAILLLFAYINIPPAAKTHSFPDGVSQILDFDAVPPPFSWTIPIVLFVGGIVLLFTFGLFIPGGIWYAVAITCIEVTLFIFLKKGALLGLTHPLSLFFAMYVVLNFVVLALAWLLLPFGRTVALTVFVAELGIAFYGYLPIASDTNPPMNWGYPRTWEGFKHAITRGQYEQISPTNIFSPLFFKQLGAYFADVRMQFTLLLAPLGFVPFAMWKARIGSKQIRMYPVAVVLAIVTALLVAIDKVSTHINFAENRIDKIIIGVLILIAFVGGHAIVVNQSISLVKTSLDKTKKLTSRVSAMIIMSLSM